MEELRSVVTGALTALLLARDGRLVLHGTTLCRQSRAVVICGNAGAGKSTQSAYLACHGWDLHADDVAPIELTAGPPAIFPGYHGIRLFPDSLQLVGLDAGVFPLIYRGTTKRLATLGPPRTIAGSPRALAGVVLLEEAAGFETNRLSEKDAIVTLLNMQHPTAARVVDRSVTERATAFAACARLAREVPVLRVRRAKTAENLGRCAAAIAEEFGLK